MYIHMTIYFYNIINLVNSLYLFDYYAQPNIPPTLYIEIVAKRD